MRAAGRRSRPRDAAQAVVGQRPSSGGDGDRAGKGRGSWRRLHWELSQAEARWVPRRSPLPDPRPARRPRHHRRRLPPAYLAPTPAPAPPQLPLPKEESAGPQAACPGAKWRLGAREQRPRRQRGLGAGPRGRGLRRDPLCGGGTHRGEGRGL